MISGKRFRIVSFYLLLLIASIAQGQYGKYELRAVFTGTGSISPVPSNAVIAPDVSSNNTSWTVFVQSPAATVPSYSSSLEGTLSVWLQWVPGVSNEPAPDFTYIGETFTASAGADWNGPGASAHVKVDGVEDYHFTRGDSSRTQSGALVHGPKPYTCIEDVGQLYPWRIHREGTQDSPPYTRVRRVPDSSGKIDLGQTQLSGTAVKVSANGVPGAVRYMRRVRIGFPHKNLTVEKDYNLSDAKLWGAHPATPAIGNEFSIPFPAKYMPGLKVKAKWDGDADREWYRGPYYEPEDTSWYRRIRLVKVQVESVRDSVAQPAQQMTLGSDGLYVGSGYALSDPGKKPILKAKVLGSVTTDATVDDKTQIFDPEEETLVVLFPSGAAERGEPVIEGNRLKGIFRVPGSHVWTLQMCRALNNGNVGDRGAARQFVFNVADSQSMAFPGGYTIATNIGAGIDVQLPINGGVAPYHFKRNKMLDSLTVSAGGRLYGSYPIEGFDKTQSITVYDSTGKSATLTLPFVSDPQKDLDRDDGLALFGLPIRSDDYTDDEDTGMVSPPQGPGALSPLTNSTNAGATGSGMDPFAGNGTPINVTGWQYVTETVAKGYLTRLMKQQTPFTARSRRGNYLWFNIAGDPHVGHFDLSKTEPRVRVGVQTQIPASNQTTILVNSKDAQQLTSMKAKWAAKMPGARIMDLDHALWKVTQYYDPNGAEFLKLKKYYVDGVLTTMDDNTFNRFRNAWATIRNASPDANIFELLDSVGQRGVLKNIRGAFWSTEWAAINGITTQYNIFDLAKSHWSYLGTHRDGTFVAIKASAASNANILPNKLAEKAFPGNVNHQRMNTLTTELHKSAASAAEIEAGLVEAELQTFKKQYPHHKIIGWFHERMQGVNVPAYLKVGNAGKYAGRGFVVIGAVSTASSIYVDWVEGRSVLKSIVSNGAGFVASAGVLKASVVLATTNPAVTAFVATPLGAFTYLMGTGLVAGVAYFAAEKVVEYVWEINFTRKSIAILGLN